MTNKNKRPDEQKTWRDQGSQNDRNRGGQQHQDSDPQTDPRRQQGGWAGDEGDQDRRRSDDGQQQAETDPKRQQGGWSRDEDGMKHEPGRKPPMDRDRDYDPDGDRTGR
ncbi:hypothetical protein [Mesorhizobium sp. ZC-5]|uniref:hypothetical protein n=1 Tax=Mesorhizobium sp. ZC-5 TaxID=2986066 RepID=UPI0021E8F781|nr:hypothetical protein [Mesorhizobium sp. ZC-5]MCV3240573.1 hypothetical protein [Mesorhizobium sp. ZC-5]